MPSDRSDYELLVWAKDRADENVSTLMDIITFMREGEYVKAGMSVVQLKHMIILQSDRLRENLRDE